jgi:hypothetical protein
MLSYNITFYNISSFKVFGLPVNSSIINFGKVMVKYSVIIMLSVSTYQFKRTKSFSDKSRLFLLGLLVGGPIRPVLGSVWELKMGVAIVEIKLSCCVRATGVIKEEEEVLVWGGTEWWWVVEWSNVLVVDVEESWEVRYETIGVAITLLLVVWGRCVSVVNQWRLLLNVLNWTVP